VQNTFAGVIKPSENLKSKFKPCQVKGLSPDFHVNVGHATHDLKISDIRFIEPNVTSPVQIPTIRHYGSPEVLSAVPEILTGNEDLVKDVPDMQILDFIINYRDQINFNVENTFFQEIVHEVHMKILFEKIKQKYEALKKDPPSEEICKCAIDVEHNGVLLLFNAMKHYLLSIPKVPDHQIDSCNVNLSTSHLSFGRRPRYKELSNYALLHSTDTEMVFKSYENVEQPDDTKQKDQWRNILQMSQYKDEAQINDPAVYLHCHLKTIGK